MTPFELSVLLHYYACANDFRDGDFQAPIFEDLIPAFIAADLLDITNREAGAKYKIGERGKAYIEHLLKTPLPTKKWVIE